MSVKPSYLREAVQAARSGQKQKAKALFLDIIAADENNELAWLWLSGLVDELEDQIIALENALMINPQNEKAQRRLEQLLQQRVPTAALELTPTAVADPVLESKVVRRPLRRPPSPTMRQAIEAFKVGDYATAHSHAGYVVKFEQPDAYIWMIYARTAETLEEEIEGVKQILKLEPGREKMHKRLEFLQEAQKDTFKLAEYFTDKGQVNKARAVYQKLAKQSPSVTQRQEAKARLRQLSLEESPFPYKLNSPNTTFGRLLFGPLLLYVAALIVLSPSFMQTIILGGLGVLVIGGSGLNILMNDAVNHSLVYKFFGQYGLTNEDLRTVLSGTGKLLTWTPFLLLFIL